MNECLMCNKNITTKESLECNDYCYECHQIGLIKKLAAELREARITFEELTRKLISEVDR